MFVLILERQEGREGKGKGGEGDWLPPVLTLTRIEPVSLRCTTN